MKNIILAFLIVFSSFTFGQQGKVVIGATPFSCQSNYCQYAPMVYEAITNAMSETGRFNFVDRGKTDAINNERELQKGEEFLDGKVVAQGKSIGADFIMTGSVAISTSQSKVNVTNSNGQVTGYKIVYIAYLNIGLKVASVETGQITSTKTIVKNNNTGGGFLAGFTGSSSPEQAVIKLIGDLRGGKEVKQWIGEAFPIKSKVVKIHDADKKLLLISGGSELGLKEKTDVRIVLYEDTEVDGKIISRTIDVATGTIQKIEDANFSECKIKNKEWGDVVARINEGKKLFVITTE